MKCGEDDVTEMSVDSFLIAIFIIFMNGNIITQRLQCIQRDTA